MLPALRRVKRILPDVAITVVFLFDARGFSAHREKYGISSAIRCTVFPAEVWPQSTVTETAFVNGAGEI